MCCACMCNGRPMKPFDPDYLLNEWLIYRNDRNEGACQRAATGRALAY